MTQETFRAYFLGNHGFLSLTVTTLFKAPTPWLMGVQKYLRQHQLKMV